MAGTDTAHAETVDETAGSGRDLDALGVLADPQRRQILLRVSEGAMCTCTDLVAATGVGQPTVSHHLKVLREAGLVRGERCGRFVQYTAVPERLRAIAAVLGSLADRAETGEHG